MFRRLILLFFLASPALAFESVQLKKTIPAPASIKTPALTQIAVDRTGRLWVTDPANDSLHQFSPEGDFVQSLGHHGVGAG